MSCGFWRWQRVWGSMSCPRGGNELALVYDGDGSERGDGMKLFRTWASLPYFLECILFVLWRI